MWKEGWEQNLERAVRAIKAMDDVSYLTLKVDCSGNVEVFAYPNDDEEEKRRLISGLTHLVGKMNKKISGSEISMEGCKDGISVNITNYGKCEIVGYVEEEVPEVITTGHTIKRKVPVSDCELKLGKFAGKQVIIDQKETQNV